MFTVLRKNDNLRRLILAHAQSQLGSGAAYVALVLIAMQRLHGGWGISLVLLSDFLPGVVLSPYAGSLADLRSRKWLAISGDLLRAVAFAAVVVSHVYWVLIPLTLLAGVGSSLWRPAINATLPSLVDDSQRSAASAAFTTCITLGMTVGPGLGAVVLLFSSPTLLLAVNSATFLVSAALIAGIAFPPRPAENERAATAGGRRSVRRLGASLRSFASSVRAISRLGGVGVVVMISALSVLTAALINVAEPILAKQTLHGGADGYSLLVAIYGAGALLGTAYTARLPSAPSALMRIWEFGIIADGLMMVGSGLAPVLAVAALTFLLTGTANALITGPAFRLVQELVPDSQLGLAFGVNDSLSNGAYVIAFLLAGLLESSLGARGLFGLAGSTTLVLGVFAAFWAAAPSTRAHGARADSSDDSQLTVV